jgi:hypothetical protein
VASGLLVLVLSLAVAVLVAGRGLGTASQNPAVKAAGETASLALSPSSGDYAFSPSASYPVGIVFDSGSKAVDGVDVIIKFDPRQVQIAGGKIAAGTLFEEAPVNTVDNLKGEIRFSALTFNPRPVAGILGTFQMKPVAAGGAELTFAFAPGATVDSNAAEHGTARDILGKAEGAKFNFK